MVNIKSQFKTIMQDLCKDNISQEQALEISWTLVQHADQEAHQSIIDLNNEQGILNIIAEQTANIPQSIDMVIQQNRYSGCHRGYFQASLVDLHTLHVIDNATNTAGSQLDICQFDGTCCREIAQDKHFDAYNNCPARHACERLRNVSDNPVIWVEGGAIRINNDMQAWGLDTNSHRLHKRIYPCLRCLSHAMVESVQYLGIWHMNADAGWRLTFHDVQAHTSMLMVANS